MCSTIDIQDIPPKFILNVAKTRRNNLFAQSTERFVFFYREYDSKID